MMGKCLSVFSLFVFIFVFWACSSSGRLQREKIDGPEQAFQKFMFAVDRKDFEEAIDLLYEPPELSRKKQKLFRKASRRKLTSWSEFLQRKEISIDTSRVKENTALVVLVTTGEEYKKGIDPDPAYLIKKEKKWSVLPDMTDYDHRLYGFGESTIQNFQDLEKWFEGEKQRIKDR